MSTSLPAPPADGEPDSRPPTTPDEPAAPSPMPPRRPFFRRLRSVATAPAARMLVRICWIIACGLFAFWNTLTRTLASEAGGDLAGYALIMPLVALLLGIGLYRRRTDSLPIHDRQTDVIVGGTLLLGSIAVKGLLVPRYGDDFLLLRLDLLAVLVYAAGASVLLFGLRPTVRLWPGWVMLALLMPLPYRMAVVAFGGTVIAAAIAAVIAMAVAMAIAVGRTLARAVVGFAATCLVGAATLAVMAVAFPNAPGVIVKCLPAVVAGVVVGAAMYVYAARSLIGRGHSYPLLFARAPTTATGLLRAAVAILAAAVWLAAIGLPPATHTHLATGPVLAPTAIPEGWQQQELQRYGWASRYFGQDASLTRRTLQADEPNPAWDSQGRRRTLVVDTLDTTRPGLLDIYPEKTTYAIGRARIGPAIDVDLGHGVTGKLSTVVDEEALLTWTRLSFAWERPSGPAGSTATGPATAQRITAISVDDHRPGATFPEPEPSMMSNALRTMTVLLRGDGTVRDTDPDYKDRALLTQFAAAFVTAQFGDRT